MLHQARGEIGFVVVVVSISVCLGGARVVVVGEQLEEVN